MKNIHFGLFLLGAVLLAGCSSHPSMYSSGSKIQIDRPIYLRGVFTWWDADPQYQLQQVSGQKGLWMTEAELIADGRPYEWKIGDKDWHCGTDFGYKSDSSLLKEGQKRVVDACAEFNSIKFIPKTDGTYQFFLDLRGQDPVVYVRKKDQQS
ncbi:hypothetical protein [Celerinatantimonas sp. MCCC 1A17872]|uniref:hypothetical protein n=1 Tax=Celerinatantimonas sp. MCCC 1A17872 TaxID=3177514 RepID=UPI0038BF881D